MKKLLVTLLLAAGLVTVASAVEPLDCTNPNFDVYKCCTDVANIQNAINQSHHQILTTDNYKLANLNTTLVNDGSGAGDDSWCIDGGTYLDANWDPHFDGVFTWEPGDWQNSIKYYDPSSANKDKAIITNN